MLSLSVVGVEVPEALEGRVEDQSADAPVIRTGVQQRGGGCAVRTR